MRRNALAIALVAVVASLSGCDKPRPTQPNPSGPAGCLGCHGSLGDPGGAPPNDLSGSATGNAVGAHTVHLGHQVLCEECHKVPGRISDPGHLVKPDGTPDGDDRAEVTFGPRASGGNLIGGYTPARAPDKGGSCTVYCHGASLGASGGSMTTPSWGGPPLNCGSCHGDATVNPSNPNTTGAPPTHTPGLLPTACASCHPDTVTPGGQLTTTGTHINGQVEASGCTGCHGDAARGETSTQAAWAPPKDSTNAMTGAKVGAHLRHVSTVATLGSRLSRPFQCSECHKVPTSSGPHGQTVIQWATGTNNLANRDGLTPSYSAGTCASTYCHGASLVGGSSKTPSWNTPGGGACGTCHFITSPPAPHPASDTSGVAITTTSQCVQCHPGTVDATGRISPINGLHVNGVVEFDFHPAGYSSPTAHGPDALRNLADPAACKSCHGATFAGQGAAPSCTACHTVAGHASWLTECTFCHGAGNRAADAAFPRVGSPVAGVNILANQAAPPVGTQPGDLTPSSPAVGAHLAHIQPATSNSLTPPGALSIQIQCTECHGSVLPSDANHADGSVAIGWGPLATARTTSAAPNIITPAWEASPTCTNYCHGAQMGAAGGGTKLAPSWVLGASEVACGTCHGFQPGTWHPANNACGQCHPGFSSSSVNALTHVNGAINTNLPATGCTSCHGTQSANAAPPVATTGATSGVKVGAHQKHLGTTLTSPALGCGECHPAVSSTRHADGAVNVAWNLGATVWGNVTFPAVTPAPGALPAGWESAPNCTNYCHGGFTNGKAATVSWTSATAMTCNDCHGAGTGALATLPGGTHPQGNTTCSACHTGYSASAVNQLAHVNGQLDVNASSCTTCHGAKGAYSAIAGADSLVTAAPPTAADGTNTLMRVGAHQAHVNQASYRTSPLACADCHPIPNTHNGTRDASWSVLAANGGALTPTPAAATGYTATWEGTPTCTNYCHAPGGAENGGSNRAPSWLGGAAAQACGTCHGAPPPVDGTALAGHPQNTACASCHGVGYATTGLTGTAKNTHINRTTTAGVEKPNNGCTACHGVLAGVAGAAVTNMSPTAAPGYNGTGVDTSGASVVTAPRVGAHDAHVRPAGGLNSVAAVACSACHGALPAASDIAHADAIIAIGWSAVATNGGAVTPAPNAFGAAFEATPNCTNYCHSNAWPLGGTGATPAFSWTSAANMTCTSCHATAAFGGTNLSQRHSKHLTGYAYACDECHSTTMADNSSAVIATPGNHVNGTKNVALSSNLLSTTVNQSAGSYAPATFTCASTYCHSGGVATASPFSATASAAINWSTGTSACTSCHGWTSAAAPTIGVATGSGFAGSATHAAHVANVTFLGADYACADCHSTVVAAGNSPITDPTLHVNGTKNVAFLARNGQLSGAYVPATGTCGTTYCHSSGQATPTYRTITWTSPAMGCNGCHGPGNAAGAPDYVSGGAGSATANSHAVHTGAGATTCQNCHSGLVSVAGTTVAGSNHTNGARDVVILAAYDTNGATSNYAPATKTCSSVSCHGGGSPQWGATLGCNSCHGSAVARTPVAGADLNLDAAPPVDSLGASTGVKVGAHLAHVNQLTQRATALTCADCHPSPNTHQGTRDAAWSVLATNGGAVAPIPAAVNGFTAAWEATPTCTNYCHAPGGAENGGSNRAPSWIGGAAAQACGTCHGAPPPVDGTALAGHPQNTACAGCHGAGYATTGVTGTAKNTHINRTTTAGVEKPNNGCTACHGVLAGVAGVAVTNTSPTAAPGYNGTGVDTSGASVVTAPRVGAHDAHVRPAGGLNSVAAVACSACHGALPAANDIVHADATIAIGWSAVATNNGLVTPTPGAFGAAFEATPNCTNSCHSNGWPLGGTGATPTFSWTSAANLTCTSCHATAAFGGTNLSQNHSGHLANAAVLGANYACADCHSTVVAAGNAPITGQALHVDGTKTVAFLARGGQASGAYVPATGTCGSTYCHSSGQATPTYRTIIWAGAAIGCNGCHGQGNAAGAPDYPSGGAGTATANSHAAHTGAGATTCQNCHSGLVTAAGTAIAGTNHTNGSREVVILAAYDTNGATSNYTTATKTCSSVSCHGAGTPQWGAGAAALKCSDCHAAAADTDSFTFGTAGLIGTTEWTSSGHGQTSTNGFTAANALPTIAAGHPCIYCHDGSVVHDLIANPFRLLGPTPAGGVPPVTNGFNSAGANVGNDVCLNCHATGSNGVNPGAQGLRNGVSKIGGWHYGAKHTGLAGGQRCWDCHDPHGDGNSKMVGKTVTKLANNAHGFGAAGRVTATFTRSATPVGTDYVNAAAGASTKICQVCHTTTSHYTSTTSDSHNIASAGGCISCHTHNSATVSTAFAIPAGGGDCIGCHTGTQGGRRAIVPEFALTWSHKRSAGGTVTNFDCAVCHMEGNIADGSVNSTYHLYAAGGAIDLRDPDTGLHIKGVIFNAASGANPGSYTNTAADATFVSFSRNLGVTLEADPNAATLQAIMINQCLKCHDANGALSPSARVPTTGTAEKPFGTTIVGAGYTGAGVTAGGVTGGVADVNESFKTTNSSYHPVTGKQNNWYAKLTRMVAPWTSARTGTVANTTSWGALLSCWDCHALPADTGTITRTVTAHGGAATLRGSATATGNPSAATGVTLCIKCHSGYDTSTIVSHGPDSAWSSTGADSGMNNYIHFGCNACHSSGYSTAVVRPFRAQDAHGVDALPSGGAAPQAGSRWAGASVGTPAQVNARPYAFIRNTTQLINHQPATIGGSTYTATCRGTASPCANNMNNYTPGGTH